MGAREDHHGTRQRYTIMTSARSWHDRDVPEPPGVAVLFKGDGDRAPGLVAPPRTYVGTYVRAGISGRTWPVQFCDRTYVDVCVRTAERFSRVWQWVNSNESGIWQARRYVVRARKCVHAHASTQVRAPADTHGRTFVRRTVRLW